MTTMALQPRLLAAAIGLALLPLPSFPATQAAATEKPICFDAETASAPDEDYIASCSEIIRRGGGGPRILARAFQSRAIAYHRTGQYERSVDDLDHAIGLDPENSDMWNNRCFDNAVLRRVEAALVDCRKALAIAPENAIAWDSLGFARLVQGNDDAALGAYNRAISLAPELPYALFGRGIAKQHQGDQAGGDADIAAAKSLLPNVAEIFARFDVAPMAGAPAASAVEPAPNVTEQ
jgi:tetratricopeptide (TPR) repeat protein